MGTMKVALPIAELSKRPHMRLMCAAMLLFGLIGEWHEYKHAIAAFGAIVCLVALPFVGRETTKAVRYMEGLNVLFLMLIFCGVATS